MATKKITDLVELTSAASGDVLPIVDISDDITKKIQVINFPISTATQTAIDAKQDTLVSGTNIKTINSTSLLGSGDISIEANPSGGAGAIQFSDGSAFASDASNLFWDNTNKRLGIGTNTPSYTLDITGLSRINVEANNPILFGKNASFPTVPAISMNNTLSDSLMSGFFADNLNFYINSPNRIILRGSGSASNTSFVFSNGAMGQGYGNYNVNASTSNGVFVKDKLAVGTNSPIASAKVQFVGSGSTSATTSLLVQNSSGTELLKVRDDGNAFVSSQITANSFQCSGSGSILSSVYAKINNTFLRAGGQGINISETNTTPDGTAQLQVDSTTRGFLPPRMTTTQKNSISTPAAGLQVYDTDLNQMSYYNGTSWVNF